MSRSVKALILVAVATFLLAACTGGAPAAAPTAAPQDAPGEAFGEDGGQPSRPTSGVPDNEPNSAPVLPGEQLIIYTGSMDLEVADMPAAVQQAEQLIRGLGGHVAASQASNDGEQQTATVTYRIPAARWSDALAGIRALGAKVLNEDVGSEDVTTQVVDLEARISNLQSTEAALQAIMTQATTITDVLKVQDELTAVRSEIETLTAQRDHLAARAALATLTVNYNIPFVATAVASEGWSLGAEIDNALATLVRVGQSLTSLLVWVLIVVVPVLLPVLAFIALAVWLRRRWLAAHPPTVAGQNQPW
jgi:hypothetical protein